MKIFSAANGKPLDRSKAIACAAMNLLATPGLGTIIAGRFVSGALQLLCAATGFCLIMVWFFYLFSAFANGAAAGHAWMWEFGVIIFGLSWIASLISSLQIIRGVKTKLPPKLDGSKG